MDHQAAVLTAVTGETMVLQGVTAKGDLNGLLFELTVEQRYRNPAETNIEAVYTFPLPSAAVLLDFEVKLNGKTLTGVIAVSPFSKKPSKRVTRQSCSSEPATACARSTSAT